MGPPLQTHVWYEEQTRGFPFRLLESARDVRSLSVGATTMPERANGPSRVTFRIICCDSFWKRLGEGGRSAYGLVRGLRN